MKPYISAIEVFLPPRKVSSTEVENLVNRHGDFVPSGSVERMFGVKERRYADELTQVSDLAAKAAQPIVDKYGKENIDCLIFASACSDLIEPATANIVQHKLGLNCPAFDVKNACNSFVTALQIAQAFIISGTYRRVLIATGEKLSNSIKLNIHSDADLKNRLAALSFGDAGSAVLVEASLNGRGFIFQRFKTSGKHWPLCTIQGGGSMFPFEMEKNYFIGKTSELAEVMFEEGGAFVASCFEDSGWTLKDVDHIFTHQVSAKTFEQVAAFFKIPEEKFHKVIEEYGNTASASIPLALYKATAEGKLKKGDKVAIIGLAAGVSISVQLLVW
jgi:3-oxoacyl-[acyl-carrier-protein] synthase-3